MVFMIRLLLALLITCFATAHAAKCNYPGKPFNWIMRYCAMAAESDDETRIHEHHCYKESMHDLSSEDTCKTNEKYKAKICDEFLMDSKQFASLDDCLKHADIAPYFSG